MNKELVKRLILDLIETRRRDQALCKIISRHSNINIIAPDNIHAYAGIEDLAEMLGKCLTTWKMSDGRKIFEFYLDSLRVVEIEPKEDQQ